MKRIEGMSEYQRFMYGRDQIDFVEFEKSVSRNYEPKIETLHIVRPHARKCLPVKWIQQRSEVSG